MAAPILLVHLPCLASASAPASASAFAEAGHVQMSEGVAQLIRCVSHEPRRQMRRRIAKRKPCRPHAGGGKARRGLQRGGIQRRRRHPRLPRRRCLGLLLLLVLLLVVVDGGYGSLGGSGCGARPAAACAILTRAQVRTLVQSPQQQVGQRTLQLRAPHAAAARRCSSRQGQGSSNRQGQGSGSNRQDGANGSVTFEQACCGLGGCVPRHQQRRENQRE